MEAPRALAPLIDPNVHSCGTVPPHGVEELAQPESGFFVVGMKSYGRAPTFLMVTGYEQVRSIACALTGDLAGARRVELTLPATGACSGSPSDSRVLASVAADSATACCGGPAPAEMDACCAQDAETKAGRQVGCGCGSEHLAEAASVPSSAVPGGPQRSAPQLLAIGALRKDLRASSCCS